MSFTQLIPPKVFFRHLPTINLRAAMWADMELNPRGNFIHSRVSTVDMLVPSNSIAEWFCSSNSVVKLFVHLPSIIVSIT